MMAYIRPGASPSFTISFMVGVGLVLWLILRRKGN